MEQEISIQDNQTIKEGSNIFKLDGPIGRKKFLITCLIICGLAVIAAAIGIPIYATFDLTKYTLPIFLVLICIFTILSTYISWLNFAKRLWDLFGDKNKGIFYAIAIWLINISTSFITFMKINYIGMIFGWIVFAILIFKKGKIAGKTEEAKQEG